MGIRTGAGQKSLRATRSIRREGLVMAVEAEGAMQSSMTFEIVRLDMFGTACIRIRQSIRADSSAKCLYGY